MNKHFKPHIQKMVRYQTSQGRDLENGLRLDRNERVSDLSTEVLNDIFNRLPRHILSASPDSARLYGKICDHLNIKNEQLYVTSGITEGIRMLFETLTESGDNIVVLDPTYPMYYVYSELHGVEYRKFIYDQDLKPDRSSLEQSLDNRTRIVVIPNPNLPIESSFSREELSDIARHCLKRDIFLVVDEAYYGLGESPTVIDLINTFENLIVMRTFSKAYGLAGIRLGYMVSNSENIEYISKTRSLVESNSLTMSVAEYFLDHPQLLEQHVSEVREGSDYIQKELTKMGFRWHGGRYTNGLMIFLDSREDSLDAVNFLKEQKVYIRGGFEKPYDSCVRVSIGSRKIMEKFLKYFKEWLKNHENTNSVVNKDPAV